MSKQIYLFPSAWARVDTGTIVEASPAIQALGYVGESSQNLFGAMVRSVDAKVLLLRDGRWLEIKESSEIRTSKDFDGNVRDLPRDLIVQSSNTDAVIRELWVWDFNEAINKLRNPGPDSALFTRDALEIAQDYTATCADRARAFAMLAYRGVDYVSAPQGNIEAAPSRRNKGDLLTRLRHVTGNNTGVSDLLHAIEGGHKEGIRRCYARLAPVLRTVIANELWQWIHPTRLDVPEFQWLAAAVRTTPMSSNAVAQQS